MGAVRKLLSILVDHQIVDVVLPEIDGYEVVKAVKKANPQIKVVVMSGYSLSELAARMPETEFEMALSKPFMDIKVLLKNINALMQFNA